MFHGRYGALLLFPEFSPIDVSVQITASGDAVLGQSGYFLICGVTDTGAENTSFTYQWTKNSGTHTQIDLQVGTDRVLSFSPLRLSDAGRYTCVATVSPCSITKMDTQDVTLQGELSSYVYIKIIVEICEHEEVASLYTVTFNLTHILVTLVV